MSGLAFPNWLSGLPLYTRVLGFLRTGRLAASMLVQEAKATGDGASVGWFFVFAVKNKKHNFKNSPEGRTSFPGES